MIMLSTTLLVAFFLLELAESIGTLVALMFFMIPITVAILMIVFVGMLKGEYEFNQNKTQKIKNNEQNNFTFIKK